MVWSSLPPQARGAEWILGTCAACEPELVVAVAFLAHAGWPRWGANSPQVSSAPSVLVSASELPSSEAVGPAGLWGGGPSWKEDTLKRGLSGTVRGTWVADVRAGRGHVGVPCPGRWAHCCRGCRTSAPVVAPGCSSPQWAGPRRAACGAQNIVACRACLELRVWPRAGPPGPLEAGRPLALTGLAASLGALGSCWHHRSVSCR